MTDPGDRPPGFPASPHPALLCRGGDLNGLALREHLAEDPMLFVFLTCHEDDALLLLLEPMGGD
ncbi:MAG: hypothetical protein KJ558_17145 [Gammaproteobacteria bacterium]|nr:hypothetical protein [Gammaproteobacteria bacterium]MBU1962866.1 hypothetical protein [Gammaproteobacteria bacterium]